MSGICLAATSQVVRFRENLKSASDQTIPVSKGVAKLHSQVQRLRLRVQRANKVCVTLYSFPPKVSRGLQSNKNLKSGTARNFDRHFVCKPHSIVRLEYVFRLTIDQIWCGLLSVENCSQMVFVKRILLKAFFMPIIDSFHVSRYVRHLRLFIFCHIFPTNVFQFQFFNAPFFYKYQSLYWVLCIKN